MAEKRNIILFIGFIFLTLTYWLSASFLIAEKPFEIKVLEEEQQELNENLISAQILASQLDRVFTLFQENLALSKAFFSLLNSSLLTNFNCVPESQVGVFW